MRIPCRGGGFPGRTPPGPGARSPFGAAAESGRPGARRRVLGADAGAARPAAAVTAAAGAAVLIAVAVVFRWWILAAAVSLVAIAGATGLSVGLCVLTWVYLRETYRVMVEGGHREEPVPEGRDDPAHRGYHGGPAWWDLYDIVRRTGEGTSVWGALLAPHFLLHASVVAGYTAAAWAVAGALRAADTSLRAGRGVRMVCPDCYRHLRYPAYRCGRCGRRHRSVRPGARGLLVRTCLCGQEMPTLLILGSADTEALCPHCARPLEHRPGEAHEFLLPLFGGTGAGKTRLMAGLHLALEQAARSSGDTWVEAVGEEAGHRLREGARALSPGHRTRPTPPGRKVRGVTLRMGSGRSALVMHLFDAAGERFNRSATAEELTYLGQATTFVLAVDPLGIEAVWRSLSPAERELLARERSHTRDPELAYGAVRDEIQRQQRILGRGRRGTRLAVVVTRGDLLRGTALHPGPAPVQEWARDTLGLGNLLTAAEADFGQVRVLLTSAVTGADGAVDESLRVLLRWILDREDAAPAALASRPPATGHAPAEPALRRPL